MANNFGAYTDHFGILAIVDGAGTLADSLELIGSTKTPVAMSRADALDENGDITAATWHGNTAGELYEVSSTFSVTGGSLDTSLLMGGEKATGVMITSIEVSTSNGGWPEVTVSGMLGTEAVVAPDGYLNTWTFPSFTILAAKRAQLLAFTVGEGCKLTGSSVSGSLDSAQAEDGVGEPVAHGVSGGVLTMSAELVATTSAASWTLTGDWTETQAPGADEGQAAYHTATGTAELIWERDASA